jgi:hypothetical protein
MSNRRLVFICALMCLWTVDVWAQKCFFESDCSKDQTCVTPKGSLNGNCQPKAGVVPQDDNILGSASIIGDQGKCTFNTDCPDGGQCVKQPGSLYGTCQGSGYGVGNVKLERDSVYKDRSCYFNQDCKSGQVCVKPKGSFKGMCQDDAYQTSNRDIKDAKDPRALLQNFRNSDRQCLADQDCALREVCLKRERTVFGVCRPKSAISTTTPTTINNPSSSSNLFSDSNSLFNRK